MCSATLGANEEEPGNAMHVVHRRQCIVGLTVFSETKG